MLPSISDNKKQGHLHFILLFWLIVTPIIPIVVTLLFWFMTCAPQYLYSIFSPLCSPDSIHESIMSTRNTFEALSVIVGKFVFFLFEVLMLLPAGGFAGFITMVLIIVLTSITDFLQHIR